MASRFEILYKLDQQTYSVGLPVVITGGNLLQDNYNGRLFAQLKLKSISFRQISAVEVMIQTMDNYNRLVETIAFVYDNLRLYRDNTAGDDISIPLEDNRGKKLNAVVTAVVDSSGNEWRENAPKVSVIEEAAPLESRLDGDKQLAKQYRLKYGFEHNYAPTVGEGIWTCSCGAINLDEEDACHSCGFLRKEIMNPDFNALEQDKRQRQKKEKEHTRNIIIIGIAAALVLAIGIIVISVISPKETFEDEYYDESYEEEYPVEEAADEGYEDPYYIVDEVYYTQAVLKVREGPGKDYRQLTRDELAGEDYYNSEDYPDALLKKGSPVVCLEMSGDWMRIESGWICVRDGDETLVE